MPFKDMKTAVGTAHGSKLLRIKKKIQKRTFIDTIRVNLSTLLDILVLYGYRKTGKEIEKTIPYYREMCYSIDLKPTVKTVIMVFKYKTAAFFSSWNEDKVPTPPFPSELVDNPRIIFGGTAGRFCSLFMKRADDLKKLSFLSTVNQSKSGMARPTAKMLSEAEEKYLEDLSQEQKPFEDKEFSIPMNNDQSNLITITQQDLKREISRTVREIFSKEVSHFRSLNEKEKEDYKEKERVKAFFPSTSANYINSRTNAGSVGALLENPMIANLRQPGGFLGRNNEAKKQKPIWSVKEEMIENEDEVFYETTPRNLIHLEEVREEEIEEERIHYEPNLTNFRSGFSKMWHICKGIASREKNIAVPVALAEPNKIRTITKGPPFKMLVLRFIQKKMHTILREHPTFRLTGSPTGLEPTLSQYLTKVLGKGEGKYLSADYKAATDNLKSWASNEAAESISTLFEFDNVERELFIESLTGYYIALEDDKRGKRGRKVNKSVKQTVGQLMGSITSFPILCIINAAISRYAYEIGHRRSIKLQDCPMAVNGDDLVMKCNQTTRNVWKGILGQVGLQESIGKTFFSKKFLQINSRNFLVREKGLVQVPYVNMGLLYGLKKSGGQKGLFDQEDPTKTIGTRYRDLMNEAPDFLKEDIHELFINRHRKRLQKTHLPWYIPEWIGGIGLTGFKEPSELDLRVAQKILFNWERERPQPINILKGSWKTWEIATKLVPKPYTVDIKNRGTEEYTEAVMLHVINLLFDSKYQLKDIFQETDKETVGEFWRRVKHNRKLWKPTPGTLPQPMDVRDLKYKGKWSSFVFSEVNMNVRFNNKGVSIGDLD
jgi:hypothetical protein